jgi:hypothetical protein
MPGRRAEARGDGRAVMPEPRADAVRGALAAVTAWLDDDENLGRALAAEQLDHDPIGFLDALGGLWLVVGDATRERDVDVPAAIREIALGVALAETEAANDPHLPSPTRPPRRSLTRGEEEQDREERAAQGHRGQIRGPSRRTESHPA